jgi:hypothetical protein
MFVVRKVDTLTFGGSRIQRAKRAFERIVTFPASKFFVQTLDDFAWSELDEALAD